MTIVLLQEQAREIRSRVPIELEQSPGSEFANGRIVLTQHSLFELVYNLCRIAPDDLPLRLSSHPYPAVPKKLQPLLRITGAPVLARVYRRPRAMPQLEVGHLGKIAAIERRLAENEGLFVSAAGFRGVGLPDCIADAQRTAEKVEDWISACGA